MSKEKEISEQTGNANGTKEACCSRWHGHSFIKIAIAGLLLVLIFGLVVTIARFGSRYRALGNFGLKSGGYYMVGRNNDRQNFGNGFSCAGRDGVFSMMRGDRLRDGSSYDRVFGNVSKIEVNKITVIDNSGKEQAILSQSDTVIMSSDGEIGLSGLKTGINITALGSLDKDGILEAKTIRVQ